MYHYLVTEKKTGKTHLAECSSPAVAIADAAKGLFTAQRVEGGVLTALQGTGMETRKLKKEAAAPAEAGAGAEPPAGGDDTDKGDGAAKP